MIYKNINRIIATDIKGLNSDKNLKHIKKNILIINVNLKKIKFLIIEKI